MESKTPKSYRHCPEENYEISIFICRGRQKAHYPKCPTCEFRTKTDVTSPTPTEKETKAPPPSRQINTGSIVVKSKPPSAVIYLDGDNIGVTPAIITQVFPGMYKVKIKMDGYDAWNESVAVKANKETSLTAILQGKGGSIVIESYPTNAKSFIDGNYVGPTPETINNVPQGKYFIEVKLDGYETWGNEINIEAEKETSLTAELTKEYGSIILGSEPTKSKIFLDGIEIGTTPANLRSVPHGTHLIEVSKDGYSVWEKSVNIEPGKEKVFTAILQVKTGSVNIKSVPRNAKIFINEKYVGTTPESIMSIIPGTHEIKVQMDKYDIWAETINIEAGKENVITATLQRSTGSLMVESDPANATIFFDGKEIGTTPEIIISSAKGTHTVEVRMKGYNLWKKEVDIEPGTENSLTASLQLKTGYLNIKSKPSGAIIFINGEEAGPAPKTITELLPGTYKVEVRMDGYKSCCENVEVNADKQNQLNAVLQILTGSLVIKSEPSNATIIIDGNEVGNTPNNTAELVPGKHLVKISLEGYENWAENVEISADKENQITAALQQLTGSLNIESEPSNATIIVDGSKAGNTPNNITDLVPGKHLIEIKMKGYQNRTENVEISADKENQITVVLQQLTGSLNIESEPSNATISIDGNEVGNTPNNTTDLVPGKHLVEISMEGYENWTENVEISADKENQITAVLQQLTGSLNIESEPSNATISIDGNGVGNTPDNITDLLPGKHLVEISMEGYGNWTEIVEISADKENQITAVLQQLTGSLNIKSEPSNAVIIIDGNEVGNTPDNMTGLVPGKHFVEIKMKGYENWSESVEIEHNKETALTVALQLKASSLCIKSDPSIAVLQLKPGPVTINSVPSDATILINGKEIGTTPVSITDPDPGAYLVEVKMDGYETWNESIDIKPGKEVTITADLKMKAGSINVNSDPSDAAIYVDGKNIGTTPETISNLIHGMHLVEIKMEGHETWSENVEVNADKESRLTAILLKVTGSVNISSNPSNAIIRIGDRETGNTPSIITNLGAGKHIVEVSMDGYEMWSDTVNINPGKETAITAELETKAGSVSVKSEPSNAMVLIDGKRAGSTPETLTDIKPGMHLVEIKMKGFEKWCDSVNIDPEKETVVTAKLQINAASVTIMSSPSEATILIDSKDVGTTPKFISDISPEKHLVEVRLDGYESWSKSIDIEPAMQTELTAELQMKVGRVNISSEPSNAVILMDGKKVGTTPKILTDIKLGEHIVEVRVKGFDTWSESVDVRDDKENVIDAVLKEAIGSISIKSNLSEAVIYLDGKEVGTTPGTITSVSTGPHEIEVKMEGYAEWAKRINMKKGVEITLNAILQSITGKVSLESEPTEAMILLDGEEVGKSPKLMTGIETGKHELEVRMDGYISWLETIKVKAGREYAFTAVLQRRRGSLMITSNPSDAMIYIQDKRIGKSPWTVTELIPGEYTVEVKHDEYQTWSDKVEIVSDKEAALEAVLQAKPGSISIKSKPSDAKILIDGKEYGTTPETTNHIECGTHIVELKKDGYEIWSENVEVKPNKDSSLTAVLLELTGSIDIKSVPPNAMIIMDGKKAGTTPVTIKDLSPGTHKVDISMDGYNAWSESVEVEAAKEKEVTAQLHEIRGTVNINSRPSGALILLDSKEAGTTPKTITDLTAGMHLVEANMEGYEHWSENIKVIVGKEYTMTAALQELTGSVDIKSEPSNATILVNGKETGPTPKIIKDLRPGMHKVEVRMEGFESWSNSVEVASGKESKLTVTLQQLTCSVKINSEPSDATILIDNSEKGTTPQTIKDLSVGTHKIEVRMTGYEDWNEIITVGTDKGNTVTALLQKITGSINIQSDPSNAMILIDGNKTGTTPATIKDLSPGTHKVNISMDGHAEWKENVEIISGKEIDLTATLQMEVGSIDIKSNLSEAVIYLDGKEVGTTPGTITSVSTGPHEIEVKMEGYAEWAKRINMKKGVGITLNAILQSITGKVSLESEPTEAMILLDGEEVGKSPKLMTGIETGKHELEVQMDGYISWLETIKVKAGREYAFTAVLQRRRGSLMITSNPSDAMIYIQDKRIGKSPWTVTELIPGEYTVEVKHDEYQTWSDKVEIVSDKEAALEAVLQAKPGSISIKSKPSDARILIDGKEYGTTPETTNHIECGTHIVELKKDGYEIWSENVEVKPNKDSSLTAVLLELTGSIDIKSVPPNAMIIMDGKKAGTTPVTIKDLSPGTHKVDISMDGYNAWSESVEVEAAKEKEVTAQLHEIRGTVNINSRPSGALILLDSKEAGTTPKTITDLTAGMHLVEANMEGYEHWSENIKVIVGKEYTMTAALQERTGSVDIKSEPSNATILVNGKETGPTPKIIKDLRPGMHKVEVRMEGFESWSNSVEVASGKESKLTVTLQQLTCSVNINSKPPDATILIDNSEKGTTPQTIKDLSVGTHKIEVRMTGYEDWNEIITVGTDKGNIVTALLQKITGSINIQSDPSNAMILIDGNKTGTTPATIKDLSPGKHKVNISMDGHAEWKENVEIISGKEIDLTATLQMEVGSIDIKSNLSEAVIYLDGKEVGTTPGTITSVSTGPHEIEVKIEGYDDWKRSIIIKKGKVNSLNATLQLNIGSISVESYPEKAKIILDGKEVGKAPKRFTDIIVGTHEVVVLMDGYVTWKKTIKVKKAKETSLTVDLEKESDTVEIQADKIIKSPEVTSHEISESEFKPEKVEKKTITPPEKAEPPPIKKDTKCLPDELVKLRSIYNKISDSQIDLLPFITVREKHNSIFLCHSSIIHCYEEKPVGNGDVIIDHTTELMWYQSGSLEYFNLKKAMKWLKKANKGSYAGFNDWRLPTLEEASSLLEFESKDDNFIDPVFENKQWGTWTGDKSDRGHAWIVTFVNGTISQVQAGTPATFVRPVRSLNV